MTVSDTAARQSNDRDAGGRDARGSSKLTADIADCIRKSILPGDEPPQADWVDDAAAFMISAAQSRKQGEPIIQLASASEERRYLRLAIISDDMPFIVDSVANAIAGMGLVIDHLVHPVVSVRRGEEGQLEAILDNDEGNTGRESMIYIETARVDAKQRRALVELLASTLADVRAAVSDWPRMVELMLRDASEIDDTEGGELLKWFAGGMLTQLGHVTRRRDGSHAQLLGICRRGSKAILADASYDRAFAHFDAELASGSLTAPLAVQANRISTVHRRVPIDLFLVPVIEDGKVAALSVHAGIWTSAALNLPPDEVPRVRRQLARMETRFAFDPRGHTGKALFHALTALPNDLLVGFSDEEVERLVTTMTSLIDRPRPRLRLVAAPLARHLHAFVWLPRELLANEIYARISGLIADAADAEMIDWSLQIESGAPAMLRYVFDTRPAVSPPDEQQLDLALQAMVRGWGEAVEVAIAGDGESSRAAAIATRYAPAFPIAYRADYGANEAAIDIRYIRGLSGNENDDGPMREAVTEQRSVRLYRGTGEAPERLRLKVYQARGALPLSDAVPAFENFGFRVLGEIPTPLDEGKLGTIHDFQLELADGEATERLLDRADGVERAIVSVLNNHAENDVFNRLVIAAGLDADEVDWLRAFYRYLRQAGISYTIYTVVDAFARAPEVTRSIVTLFRATHDPKFVGGEAATQKASDKIRVGLAGVTSINDDRVLRMFRSLVDAILRTNAFAPQAVEALAFKIDSALVPGLPKPVPWREIFVYSRRVEGIHLRAGPVARGGLRWSDRRDDFRTEILGLMKAQRVKNAVIVPTGAKGGFYPKLLPDPSRDRAGWAAEGQASYEIFIRTLLSLADNIENDKVVHPQDVVVLDGDDPYFVVAADKGTAKFSDVANGIAEGNGFWLDDAFASGGSKGYDHKAMGITARGAWLSVQRHFLEMGIDVQSDPVRVVGCGDMSGDVFGNGMLLSKSIKIVAAFDHRHIFIDPDPDAAKSWKERKRLFDLPVSSWADYETALISKGGGVFARTLKTVPLSDEMRALLDTTAQEMEPEVLISAILAAPVDLLWFGGIGTYVKSSMESNVQAGDPTNDPLRIDGSQVRAKVIGEGANLGVTQAGRIEFALSGGRINTDFIDNSAGVDCSDNEVNIKIALAAAKRAGKLSEKRRVELLRDMTDEVAHLVLEDNRLQALALSIAERGGAQAIPSLVRLMELLETGGSLDRKTEGLADSESLSRRALDGRGLTRPELAVLLSSTKLVLQAAIEESDLPDDPGLVPLLLSSFPEPMQSGFAPFIKSHRLSREIIATKLANRIVNRLGVVHPFELAEEEGADLAQVAAAFTVAERLFDLSALWQRLEEAEMSEQARLTLFDCLAVAVRMHMADLLRAGVGSETPSVIEARLAKGVAELSKNTEALLGAETRLHSKRLRADLIQKGASEADAAAVVHQFDLDGAAGIADLAHSTGIEARKLVHAFTDLGARLGLDWAQTTAAVMSPSDPWERLLVAGLARDFQQMRLDYLKALARTRLGKADPVEAVARWGEAHAASIRSFRAMVARAESTVPIAPAMLAQIASQARNLLAR